MQKMIIELLLLLMIFPALIFAQHERSDHWYERTAMFRSELKQQKKGEIIFLGNSITEGFELNKYFPDLNPVNRGISGDHIDGLLERLDYSVIHLVPAKLFVLIGINDIGAGDPDSLILKNYQLLMERLSEELFDSIIYIQSILPTTDQWPNCPPKKIKRLNEQIRSEAHRYGFTWIDLYSHFANAENSLIRRFTDDGLHLNDQGYALWSKLIEANLSD